MFLGTYIFLTSLVFSQILLITEAAPTCKDLRPQLSDGICALVFDTTDCSGRSLPVRNNANGAFLGTEWDHTIRAVVVNNDCLLSLYEMKNHAGAKRSLGMDSNAFHILGDYAFDRTASSLTCKCNS